MICRRMLLPSPPNWMEWNPPTNSTVLHTYTYSMCNVYNFFSYYYSFDFTILYTFNFDVYVLWLITFLNGERMNYFVFLFEMAIKSAEGK